MAGFDARDATSLERPPEDCARELGLSLAGLRIGLPSEYSGEGVEPGVRRAVAEAVIRYRAERGLSQSALARLLGWRQPVGARLGAAEPNPSMDTLLTLARTLGLRVHVDVGPKIGVVARVTKSRAA